MSNRDFYLRTFAQHLIIQMSQFTPRTPRKNPVGNLKKVRDTVMGILYILVAAVMVWAEKQGYISLGLTFVYVLAAVFVIYGLFRLYRVIFSKSN